MIPRFLLLCAAIVLSVLPLSAVPLRERTETIDAKEFFPQRKHQELPGKVIGVLLTNAQPVLSTEGRSGPPDQLCFGVNGGSYRWVYAPVKENPMIGTLNLAILGGKTKAFPNLSMASPKTVAQWGIKEGYTLVEVEVNDGLGSPAGDAFAATSMKVVEGSKEFPLKVGEVIDMLQKKYATHLSDEAKNLGVLLDKAAQEHLKEKKRTGPIETKTLMFVTWLGDREKLEVRFLTTTTDGSYQYGNGINIELARPLPPNGPPQGGPAPPQKLPEGLRFGTSITVESGVAYEVSKDGKLEKTRIMEAKSSGKELPPPPVNFNRPRR